MGNKVLFVFDSGIYVYDSWHKPHFYKKISNVAKLSFDICNTEIAQCCQKLDLILVNKVI